MKKRFKKLKKQRKWIIFTLVIILIVLGVYQKEFLYKEHVTYKYEVDILNCCTITNEEGLKYSSYEELLDNPPEFNGEKIVTINNNIPFFDDELKKNKDIYIELSELDELGRSHAAIGSLDVNILNTEYRTEDLSTVKPSGFVQVNVKDKYNVSFIYGDKEYYHLYQRCHILAYSLGGPEVDERDIFTGTFSTNMAMQTYEKAVMTFLYSYKNSSVLYRVTPVFKGNDLVASGVLMEGYSRNHYLSFCVYIFNNEDKFEINYANGKSSYRPENKS